MPPNVARLTRVEKIDHFALFDAREFVAEML